MSGQRQTLKLSPHSNATPAACGFLRASRQLALLTNPDIKLANDFGKSGAM
jgi:hypothetical protein